MFHQERRSAILRFILASTLLSGFIGAGLVSHVSAAPGDLTRISVDSNGVQSNGESDWPTMSSDGRYVAFYSFGTNLVSGDTNGHADVFVRDTQTGAVTRVSVSSSGVEANADSYDAVISANGRYVSFISLATNLVSQTDSANTYDVFVHDRNTGTTTAVSVTLSNTLGNMNSYHQTISDDGRFIAFNSSVSSLVAGDTNSTSDIFVWDMQTISLTRISLSSSGTESNGGSYYASISGEGRYVTFHSGATNLVSGDTNAVDDIFLRDRNTNTTTRISVSSSGTQASGGHSWYPGISSNGRYVAFQSLANNLVPGDINSKSDIFLHDTQTGTTSLASVSSSNGFPNGDSQKAAVSNDGRYVTFDSKATNLVSGDTNGVSDVYLRDMLAETTTWVSLNADGAIGTGRGGDVSGSVYAHMTPNGQYIAFKSFGSNLVASDTNSTADVFVYEQELLPVPPTKTPTPTFTPTFTAIPQSFPSTVVLDHFSGSSLSSNWSGSTSGYAISSNRLDVNTGGDIYWNASYFGVDQEAYVTLTTIDQSAGEISLQLKSQSNVPTSPAQLAVVYSPASSAVQVWTYSTAQGWVQRGSPLSVTFVNGDTLGVRARSNGQVEVYRNGTLAGSQSITAWPYYSYGGYIGMFHLNASNTLLDDFGGGTMPGSATLTPTTTTSTLLSASPTPTACSDPQSCTSNVSAYTAIWKCTPSDSEACQGSAGADWWGAVVSWPSWSAYQTNARTGSNSREVVSAAGNQPLYPYMGAWADGCQVTALTSGVLIIEWRRGEDVWDENRLAVGQTYTIDLVSPQDNAMIEGDNGVTSFRVALANCNPQPFATATPTSTSTATNTVTPSPTATFTATNTPTYTPTATKTATPTSTNTPVPWPTSTQRYIQTPLPTKPPRRSIAIPPFELVTESGSTSGSLSSLSLLQQDGIEDDPAAYMQFQTPGYSYFGYKSFRLPVNASPANISSMLLQVNFKATSSSQVWTWSLYDWTTGNWVKVGDSLGTQLNEWNTLLFRVDSITRYISTTGEMRVRLQSKDNGEDAKIDYEALHITYEPLEPTPTPVVPTPVPTKPKYTFPATYTPTPTGTP